METKKGGRPKGYKVDEATKARAKQTRAERASGMIVPQASRGTLDLELRIAVFQRDREACAGCGEPYMRVPKGSKRPVVNSRAGITVVPLVDETTDLDECVTLCTGCRKSARALGVKTAENIAARIARVG